MDVAGRLRLALLLLRIGVLLVMVPWSLDKLLNPAHAGHVFEVFYRIPAVGPAALGLLGVAELVLLLAFALGVAKRFSYGSVLALHTLSTLSSYRQYLDPAPNLLFFAAWPMLAACVALYLLRDQDTLATLHRGASRSRFT